MKVFKFTLVKVFIFWITLCIFMILLLTGCGQKEVEETDSDGLSVTIESDSKMLSVNEENCNGYKAKMQDVL